MNPPSKGIKFVVLEV